MKQEQLSPRFIIKSCEFKNVRAQLICAYIPKKKSKYTLIPTQTVSSKNIGYVKIFLN